jgi:hypothetical protein
MPKEELRRQCEFYMTEFRIQEQDLISASYSDMLIAVRK